MTKKSAPGRAANTLSERVERNHMPNIRPNLVLLKPQAPRKESDCEREALRFLRSWKRARERQAIQRRGNDAKKIAQPKPKRSARAAAG